MIPFIWRSTYSPYLFADIFFHWLAIPLRMKSLPERFPHCVRHRYLTVQSFEKTHIFGFCKPSFLEVLCSTSFKSKVFYCRYCLLISTYNWDQILIRWLKKNQNTIIISLPFKTVSKAIVLCAFILWFPGKLCWLSSPGIITQPS